MFWYCIAQGATIAGRTLPVCRRLERDVTGHALVHGFGFAAIASA
jgi:hypothetical protein